MKNMYVFNGGPGGSAKDGFFKDVLDAMGTETLQEAVSDANASDSTKVQLMEAVKGAICNESEKLHETAKEEIATIEMMMENVTRADVKGEADMLMEAATDTGSATLNGVTLISFGLQRRMMISAHLHRAMATITSKLPRVKVAEKKRWIKDINGVRTFFVEAFRPAEGTGVAPIMSGLNKVVEFTSAFPLHGVDIQTETSLSGDEVLSNDIAIKSAAAGIADGFSIVKNADGTTPIAGRVQIVSGSRYLEPETGVINMEIKWEEEAGDTEAWITAAVTIVVDVQNGKIQAGQCTNPDVKNVTIEVRPSNETHLRALQVGFQIDQKTIEIPDGEHIEAKLVKELQDDADAYYGLDMLQENTELLTESITQIRDNKIFDFLKNVTKIATYTFNCEPTGTYARSKEEYMKETFLPFLDKIAIQLKDKTQIKDAHFRVVGNPADVRLAANNDFVYQKSQVYDGSITLDYDFSLVNGVHTFYVLSSDRVPKGKMYAQLIPNKLEDNIITTVFAQYKVWVSNNYRASGNNALPATVMSDRSKAFDYFPVVAEIVVTNNDI